MVRAVDFTVPGIVKGKDRARVAFRYGKAIAYTPSGTAHAEAAVKLFAARAMGRAPLLDGPLKLSVWVRKKPPESWSEKKKAAEKFVVGKPDCDNVLKLIADAMNRIVYHDDSRIAQIEFHRFYAGKEPECVRIRVETLEERNG